MNLADLYMYVSTEIGWLHLVNIVLIGVIAYQGYKIHELKKHINGIWKWCEITEELDRRTHKQIEKLERRH